MSALLLNTVARLVLLQFSFSNPAIIPDIVRRREAETKTGTLERKEKQKISSGILAIPPTENVSLLQLVGGLESAGYVLVDGLYQARPNLNKPDQMYHMVRFIFARREHAEPSDEFMSVRPLVRSALQDICTQAFWRIRAFSNPFYKDGVEVEDVRALSFNFEARVPRFLPDGRPVVSRRKDENGRKIGEPIPLEPTSHLVAKDGSVSLV